MGADRRTLAMKSARERAISRVLIGRGDSPAREAGYNRAAPLPAVARPTATLFRRERTPRDHHDFSCVNRTTYRRHSPQNWPFDPQAVSVRVDRRVPTDGKSYNLRVEMGVLQLETHGPARWPATRASADSFYDHLLEPGTLLQEGEEICHGARSNARRPTANSCSSTTAASAGWPCSNYDRAVVDADHSLGLMDFLRAGIPPMRSGPPRTSSFARSCSFTAPRRRRSRC